MAASNVKKCEELAFTLALDGNPGASSEDEIVALVKIAHGGNERQIRNIVKRARRAAVAQKLKKTAR